MAKPDETIGIWDRIFNRTRKEIIERGQESWHHKYYGAKVSNSGFSRDFVIYKIIDRVTGSETIKKEYLN